MKGMALKLLLFFCMVLGCGACGGGGGNSAGQPHSEGITGTAQKGPLILGSQVTVQELNPNLSPTGKQYTYQITSDLGAFTPNPSYGSRYLSLTATGYYFDETTGNVSSGPITLTALADLNTDSRLNINVMTTLTYERVKTLVANGLTFTNARAQAQMEMLAAFHITNTADIGNFDALDLGRRWEGDKALAAISSIFVQGNSAGNVAQLIANFQADLADNGMIDDAATLTAIATASKAVNPMAVAQNLSIRYRGVGITFVTTDISDYLDQQGDGIIGKYKFVTSGATPSTLYTSPAYTVGPYDGTTFSTTAGTLNVNGFPAMGSSATVTVGDQVSISMVSGSGVGAVVTADLSNGARTLARFTVQNKLQLGTLVSTISNIGSVNDVKVSADGKTLFVATSDSCEATGNCSTQVGDSGLYLFDVSNPANPVKLSKTSMLPPGYSWVSYTTVALSADSTVAFAGTGAYLQIFDVSNLQTPAPISSVGAEIWALTLSADYKTAYTGAEKLCTIDISNLSSPSAACTIPLNKQDFTLTVSPDSSQIFGVAEAVCNNNVEVVPLTGTTVKANVLYQPPFEQNIMAATYIGDKLLLTAGRYYISVYDMTDPTSPIVIGKTPSGVTPLIWGIGSYWPSNGGIWYNAAAKVAYIVAGTVLQLVDVSNPASPVIMSKVSLPAENVSVIRDGIAASSDNSTVYVVNNGKVLVFHVGGA